MTADLLSHQGRHISFIGMSNVGKTFWSKKMKASGFIHFCIDDMIEEELGTELKKLGYQGISDVAKWMGHPFDPQYPDTSLRYLEIERDAMQKVLDRIEQKEFDGKDVVLDTTGSVIYLGDLLLQRIKKHTTVLFFETPAEVQQDMYQQFLTNPKPLIWGNQYAPKPDEAPSATLERCYPQLLSTRTARYASYADAVIPYHEIRNGKTTVQAFLRFYEAGVRKRHVL